MASLTRPAATRYCWIAATTAALLVAAVVAVNLVVDPFGVYRLVVLEGVNAYKPAVPTRVRLVKAYEVRRLRPRGIILGTSRSHVGLRPSHDGWDPAARPVYNLAFDGATTKEMYHYLLHAHAVQPLRQAPALVFPSPSTAHALQLITGQWTALITWTGDRTGPY